MLAYILGNTARYAHFSKKLNLSHSTLRLTLIPQLLSHFTQTSFYLHTPGNNLTTY